MKIGRLEFFITRHKDTILWTHFDYNCGLCQCRILTLGPIGVTLLSKECL